MLDINKPLVGTYRTGKNIVTCGRFTEFMGKTAKVFNEYFNVELFPGSFNIDLQANYGISDLSKFLANLDDKNPKPDVIVPEEKLRKKLTEKDQQRLYPKELGNGHAWKCNLYHHRYSEPTSCWIFRRVSSGVNYGIEIIAEEKLAKKYNLKHGDVVTVIFNHLR